MDLLELRGDQGARVLFRDLADQIFEVEMPDDAVLVDIDTEAALDAVLTRVVQGEATQDSIEEPRLPTGWPLWKLLSGSISYGRCGSPMG